MISEYMFNWWLHYIEVPLFWTVELFRIGTIKSDRIVIFIGLKIFKKGLYYQKRYYKMLAILKNCDKIWTTLDTIIANTK